MAIELTEQLLAQIDGYLKETLSITERAAFEQRLQNEPELKEEVRLQQQLFDIIGKEQWHTIERMEHKDRIAELTSKLRSSEYQDLSANLRNAEKAYLEETSKVSPFKKYYRYIAVAAAIIIFFGMYFTQMRSSYRSYYETYVNWSDLPSYVEKGQEENTFLQGETAFKQENYQQAILFFQKMLPTYELYNASLLYIGAAYDQLDENDKAIAAFQQLASVEDSYERSKGIWYTAMLYLKIEDKEKAVSALMKLVADEENYNYEKAKVLLEELK
ncbi:MAG: tetratricopeptide repeat protein [Bacteroidota bacterium]